MTPNDVSDLRDTLIEWMCSALESALAYYSIQNEHLYRYYCGKAEGYGDLLHHVYGINAEDLHDEHIDAMLEFVEEHW